MNWEDHVEIDKRFERPLDVDFLCGDASKAKKELGWKPRVKFNKLVDIMVEADLKRWERWGKGERFPWDAPNYPNENKILSRQFKLDR